MNTKNESGKINLTGLWATKDENGYLKSLSGAVTARIRLFIVPNRNRKGKNSPDYIAFLESIEKQPGDVPVKVESSSNGDASVEPECEEEFHY